MIIFVDGPRQYEYQHNLVVMGDEIPIQWKDGEWSYLVYEYHTYSRAYSEVVHLWKLTPGSADIWTDYLSEMDADELAHHKDKINDRVVALIGIGIP